MVIDRKHKNKIISMCKQGKSSNEIIRVYPAYTRQQIAAVKAWVTMGKY